SLVSCRSVILQTRPVFYAGLFNCTYIVNASISIAIAILFEIFYIVRTLTLHYDGAMTKRLPRYAWLHQTLLSDIESGHYPVGAQLPTEHQLCHIYSVSRHTVREATRRLAQAGLISRSAGSGTVVIASQPETPAPVFVSAFGSLQDLMRYTEQTRLEVLGAQSIFLDEKEAGRLRTEQGQALLMLHTRRRLVKDDKVISYTRVYMRPEFAGVRDRLVGNHPSVFSL